MVIPARRQDSTHCTAAQHGTALRQSPCALHCGVLHYAYAPYSEDSLQAVTVTPAPLFHRATSTRSS